MFSNTKKFIKKNILLIGIVVLLIIIAVYFLYINVKEGFDGPAPEKAQLIPVSIIEQVYNKLPDPNNKTIVAPLVELYALFVANYNDAFEVSLQIIAANKDISDTLARVAAGRPQPPLRPSPAASANPTAESEFQAALNAYQVNSINYQQLSQKEFSDVKKKWSQKINPGIQKVLTNAIKWLPTAKRFYDNFVSNNYYGLMDRSPTPKPGGGGNLEWSNGQQLWLTLTTMSMNALWNEDKLSIVLGPAFAKSNPKPPIPMPVNNEQFIVFLQNTSSEITQSIFSKGFEYMVNLGKPFIIIQEYLTQTLVDDLRNIDENSVKGFIQNNAIPNTIIQLIDQLNVALGNDATDQSSIRQLTGQLNVALANDETDQSTITNLQEEVKDLQSRKPDSSSALSNLAKLASKKGRK